jgi:hypothetical protein
VVVGVVGGGGFIKLDGDEAGIKAAVPAQTINPTPTPTFPCGGPI